ncbi:hypothetical protein V8E55_006980 [Tylopilus felleus]
MLQLSQFELPLQPNQVPSGYDWDGRDISSASSTSACNSAVLTRDTFLGEPACIICGRTFPVEHCYIISPSEHKTWVKLREKGWIPQKAKRLGEHESRNGLTLCSNHRVTFDKHYFFIRYSPDIRKFVFINYSGNSDYKEYHGKAVALEIDDPHAPFPALLIIHEMRVRGFHPFQDPDLPIPNEIPWQDWLQHYGAISDSGTFNRTSPPKTTSSTSQQELQAQPAMMGMGTSSTASKSGLTRTLTPLNSNLIAEILAATQASVSWKACVMEETSWDGTAEENIKKYMSDVGVDS